MRMAIGVLSVAVWTFFAGVLPAEAGESATGLAASFQELEIPLGRFADSLDSWWVYAHDKVPQTEALVAETVDGVPALRISADFSRGGDWFNAIKQFDQPAEVAALSLRVRTDNFTRLTLRITGASGQSFSKDITLKPGGGWQEVVLRDLPGGGDPAKTAKEQLFGAQVRINVALSPAMLSGANKSGTLWLAGIEAAVRVPRGKVYVPGASAVRVGGEKATLRTERSTPLYWGAQDKPGKINLSYEAEGRGVVMPPVYLRDHDLRILSTLHKGGEAIVPGKPLRMELAPAPAEFGLYYISTEVGGEPLLSSFAWLAEEGKPDPEGPFGIQTHFGQGPWGKMQHIGSSAEGVELIRKMGAGWIRDDGRLGNAGKEGHFNFLPAAKAAGIASIMNFVDFNQSNRPPVNPQNIAKYAGDFSALVKENWATTKVYEVWNEPNISPGWRGDPSASEYFEILKAAYQRVKKDNPEAQVLGVVSCGTDFDYIKKVLELGGTRYMDGLSAHPYHGVAPERAKEGDKPNPQWMGEGDSVTFVTRMETLRKILDSFEGKHLPVYATEMGSSAMVHDDVKTPRSLALTESRLADWLVRQYLLGMGLPYLRLQVTYNFVDQGYDADPQSHMTFGMLRSDATPETRFVAYNTMSRLLHGLKFAKAHENGPERYVYSFSGAGGEVLAAWRVDTGGEWSFTAKGAVEVTDLMGNMRKIEPVAGRVTLPLTGSPLFVRGLNGYTSAAPLLTLQAPPKATSEDVITLRLKPEAGFTAGKLRVLAPGDWQTRITGQEVEITPDPGAATGEYTLTVFSGAMGAAATVTLDNAVQMTSSLNAQGGIDVVFRNPFPTPRTVEFRPRSNLNKLKAGQVSLPPAAIHTTSVEVEPLTKDGFVTVPVMLNTALAQGQAGIIELGKGSRNLLVAGYTPCYPVQSLKIDGADTDWPQREQCLLNQRHQAKGIGRAGASWQGVDDLSARFITGYDAENFYALVRVRDDKFVQSFKPDQMWKGDAVQLAFYNGGERYEFTLGLAEGGDKVTVHQSAPKKEITQKVVAAALRKGVETVYEVAIPWAELGGQRAGEAVRFALVVCDNDNYVEASATGGRKGYLEWFEGVAGADGKIPELYGPLKLLKD